MSTASLPYAVVTYPLPDPHSVGRRAAQIEWLISTHPMSTRLRDHATGYLTCWNTFMCYPLVAAFDTRTDGDALYDEAIRVLCLRAALAELADDDSTIALLASPPVEEMVRTVLAQYTLCHDLTNHLGIRFLHTAEQDRFGWQPGDYTDTCYRAAGWGEPPARYWIDAVEVQRRLAILDAHYGTISLHNTSDGHRIDFAAVDA